MTIQKDIERQNRRIFIKRTRIVCLYMATPLVLSFSFADAFFSPENMWNFFFVRIWIVPTSLAAFLLTKSRWIIRNFYYAPISLVILFLGCYHALLTSSTGYEQSAYYAGINLALIVSISFFPWAKSRLWIPILLNTLPFATSIVLSPEPINLGFLVPNSAFIISTAFLGVLSYFVTQSLRLAEISRKFELKMVTKRQAKVIAEKTEEGVFLEKLTTQFSPQIVHAVKRGDLKLDSRDRRMVTCIFVDIQDSTERSRIIDHTIFLNLLEDFFDVLIKTFLKYDITIGTFLGDGLLAFSNAPQKNVNHQKNAIDACLELIELHKKRARYYKEDWKTEFNIRIGVDTGFASVGFFPSKSKGTYTAVGQTVNMASRLCEHADINSICVTKSFLLAVELAADVQAKKSTDEATLKGFVGSTYELYSLTKEVSNEASKFECALCDGKMGIESTVGELSYLKCVKCDYRDLVETIDLSSSLSKKIKTA